MQSAMAGADSDLILNAVCLFCIQKWLVQLNSVHEKK